MVTILVQILVVAGGTGTYASSYAALDTAEILHQTKSGDWAGSGWTFGPQLPRALSIARAAPLESRLLLMGGFDDKEDYHDSVTPEYKTSPQPSHQLLWQVLELSFPNLEQNYWTQVMLFSFIISYSSGGDLEFCLNLNKVSIM